MAETEYSIQVEHVEKSFRVFLDKGQSFKERLLFRKRNRYEIRPVLRDISFQVKRAKRSDWSDTTAVAKVLR